MNRQRPVRLAASFEPEIRFEVKPGLGEPFRAKQENNLERLKARLLQEALEEVWDAELNSGIRRAANEAVAIAWITPTRSVLPVLFQEKVEAATLHLERQDEIRQRSRELLAV